MKYIIFESLNLINFFICIYKFFFGKEDLFYLKCNKILEKFLNLIKFPIKKIDFNQVNKFKDNLALEYEKQKLINELIDTIISIKYKNHKMFNKIDKFYLERMSASFHFDGINKLLNNLLLIDCLKKENSAKISNITFFSNNFLNFETVSKLLNKRSNDIFIKKNISLRLFYPFPFLILKILYLRIIFLFSFKKI